MSTGLLSDRGIRWATIIVLLLIVAVTILHINSVYFAVGPFTVFVVYDSLLVISVLLSIILGIMLWASFDAGEVHKTIWGLLALGMACWAVGEVATFYYEVILWQDLPYPSISDVFWVGGYVPLFAAFILRYRSLGIRPTRTQIAILIAVFAVIFIVCMVLVIGPILLDTEYESILEQALDAVYPLGDLVIAFGAMLVVMVLAGGELSWSWALIAAGFLVVGLADLLYSYTTWHELYRSVGGGTNLVSVLSDVPYLASYFIIVLGMWSQVRLRKLRSNGMSMH